MFRDYEVLFVCFLKRKLGVGHGFSEVERPEFCQPESQTLKLQGIKMQFLGSSVLEESMACSPACHWTTHTLCKEISLIQNN